MDDGGTVADYVFFGVLLLFELFLCGFDSALGNLNVKELTEKAEGEDKRARRLRDMLLQPQVYNNTYQLVITLIQLIMGGFFLMRLIEFGRLMAPERFRAIIIIVATAALMYILLVFGVLVPRRLAAKRPEKWAYSGVYVVSFLIGVLKPLTVPIWFTARGILWLLKVQTDQRSEDVTEERIISMVNEGHEQGVLLDTEAEMINNIIEFGDKEAQDIMTPRNLIKAIDVQMTLSEAVLYMLGENKSRFPVYEENIDAIVGIMHLRDAMRAHADETLREKPVAAISGPVREAVFIPETKKIDGLFQYMQQAKTQLVVVIDEYGQTQGLIAMEDILEEIVGNIMDEYDEDEGYIAETGNGGEYLIDGITRLEELEERFGISFEEEEVETLNGFMISQLDRIPDENEQFEVVVDGYNFAIQAVENNRISSVLVTKCES
ncbi:MAG: hemolysin family protein [Lachnospiraceae bacterium]|jgi:putative hemolysin|nr:hemolysin family protein [Lachnospiraceae bacterium]